jgi:hypothetical protein
VTLSISKLDDYTITVWHPQLDNQNNKMTVPFTINNPSHQFNLNLNIALLDPILTIQEQTGQDEFDFLEEY